MKPVKREQTTPSRFSLATVVLAAVLAASGVFCSCTKMEVELLPSHSKQITLSASMGTIGVETEAQSRTQTKAPVVDTEVQTLYFARADETSPGTYGNGYATTAISATRPAGTGDQQLTFNPTQYYRTDKLKTKLTGWYPSGSYNSSTRTVSWTINGEQDIIIATRVEGSTLSHIPSSITFNHRLTQLRFHPYAEDQNTIDAWGKITKIEVLNQPNTVSYALSNDHSGGVTISGNSTNSFSAGVATTGVAMSLSTTASKVSNAKQVGNPVIIAPLSSLKVLKLRITTEKQTREVSLSRALTAGTPYRLYLCFKPLDITIDASVVKDWVNVTTNDKLGYMRVGDYYFTDGTTSPKLVSGKTASGVVYYIDPADATQYKVFSLDQGSNKMWAAKSAYLLGAAGQSLTNGKANVAAMKAYSENNTTNSDAIKQTTGVFATDFPAAAFCDAMNTDGVTGWYLPAKHELDVLYNAYKANTTVLEKAITASGGTAMTSGYYCSSSEYDRLNNYSVIFLNGFSNIASKNADYDCVRCVRNIAPPPAVGDYYFTDGTTSPTLVSGKTANGVIYYVDPNGSEKYKVLALEEYSVNGASAELKWAAKNTYVIGARGQNNADGKANVAALKAYSANNTANTNADKKTTGVFATDFPAASYCDNYQGKGDAKGTWYLPAKNELQYLWCAFNGVDPGIWESGTTGAPAKNTAAQDIFNKYLIDAGGTKISSENVSSSTEYSDYPGLVWFVKFLNGYTSNGGKISRDYVRCVREN